MEIIPFNKEIDLGFSPVMTVGMFDGVHIGHQKLLTLLKTKARELGTKPIVITFDNHPRLILQPKEAKDSIKLLQTNEERFEKLFSLGFEKIITIPFSKEFSQISAVDFLDILMKKYSPQYLLMGYDNNFGRKYAEEFEDLVAESTLKGLILERTEQCVFFEKTKVSSTQIRKALEEGNIKLASSMLGGDYIFNGTVIQGNQIGRTINFPTANIGIDENKLLPRFGVYAVRVNVENKFYDGVLNIGIRPTIDNSPITIETFIFDYKENLYDKKLRIHFIEYIRPEEKFYKLEGLKAQIELDCIKAKEILSIQ